MWVSHVTFCILRVPDYKFAMLIYFSYIYVCMRTHDTSCSFEPIFMKFTWSVRSTHGWTLLFLQTIGSIKPQIWGKMWPQNQFFCILVRRYGFLKKKLENCIRYLISQKKVILIFVVRRHVPQKWHAPKIIFHGYFGKFWFFFEKMVKWQYLEVQCPLQKKFY